MNNDNFLDSLMAQMIKMVEFQTQLGLKMGQLEKEIRGIQDACADIHEAITTKWEK